MPTILLNKIRIGGKAPKNIQKGGVDVKTVYKVNYYDSYSYRSIGSFTFEPNTLNNYYFDLYDYY